MQVKPDGHGSSPGRSLRGTLRSHRGIDGESACHRARQSGGWWLQCNW
ncbi:hypothetical protein OK016_27500 [Vibrio chagasii]|nr:hypothetical protein [Vibrio chagasii]